MNVDVSPNGETLIFDLLGDIYWMPIQGGDASPLTFGRAWDQAPRFSSDGKAIYFVSDREGLKNIWRLTLSGRTLFQVTRSDADIMGTPNWSQDGSHLLAGLGDAYLNNAEVTLQSITPHNGEITPIDAPGGPAFDWVAYKPLRPIVTIFSAVQSASGQVYYSQSDGDVTRMSVRLHTFDPKTKKRTTITPEEALYSDYKPQLSNNGKLLAYFRQYNDRRTELRILDRSTGQDEALTELTNADDVDYGAREDTRPNYAFTPDDGYLVFWHAGNIRRLKLADRSLEIIPFRVTVKRDVWERAQPTAQRIHEFIDAKFIRWPSVSRDGQTIAFAAIGYVWVMEYETSRIRRLTTSNAFEYMPAISPDGRSIAYVSFAETDHERWPGRLMVADVEGGVPRQVLAGQKDIFMLPSWSQDSQRIALIREVQTDTGIKAAFGWTSAINGVFNEVASAPASDKFIAVSIYARFVSFDEDGQHLLLGFPTSRTETSLATVRLDGSAQRTLAIGAPDVGGIAPAPDLKHLALIRRDGTAWVVPFGVSAEIREVGTSSPDARRVGDRAGYYVAWNGLGQITFGFGQNIYRYDLGTKIAEVLRVKVRFNNSSECQPVVFQGARLLTMSTARDLRQVIDPGTLVLNGQRIAAVGSIDEVAIPPNALVIDVAGKTIMPGLIDSHYHRVGGRGRGISAFRLPNPNFSDRSAIAYGVTTAWEPGGPWNDGVPATVELQFAGRILGPRWTHSAMGSVGYPWKLLTSYTAALAAVEQHQEMGVAVLKEYNTPSRQQRQWLSAAARQKGLGIISHLGSFDDMMTRIVDGYTGGDHSYIPVPFYRDVRELMRQTGYIWSPNIVITSGTSGGYEDVGSYFWRFLLDKRPNELEKLESITMANRLDRIINASQGVPYEVHRVRRVAEQAASAAAAGVHIGISAHNMPAVNLHSEMWYLWKGGLPIEKVLRAATIGNAEKLGLQEEIGSLEPGKVADFLVLDENPLDDILNALSLKYTVQGGVLYDSANAQRTDLANMQ
ncbi:MAG: amidohydrolase family protein [Woeseia sp.]